MRKRGGHERRLDSWTGTGHIDVDPMARERSTVLDVALIVLLCLAFDLVALIVTILASQTSGRIICAALCFDNPHAHIHDAEVALWAFGIAIVLSAAFSLYLRRARIPVVIVQGIIAAFVLTHTLPDLHTAQHRLDIIEHCDYGAAPPCTGVTNLGPP